MKEADEREKESCMHVYIHVCMYVCMYIHRDEQRAWCFDEYITNRSHSMCPLTIQGTQSARPAFSGRNPTPRPDGAEPNSTEGSMSTTMGLK